MLRRPRIMLLRPTVVAITLLLVSGVFATKGDYRLPLQVVPVAYDVSLVPYLDNEGNRTFTFDGVVNIDVTAKKNVANITLHYADMTIGSIEVSNLTVEEHTLEDERNFLTIRLKKPLVVGTNHTITIHYRGNIRRKYNGFYRSYYKTPEGEKRWLGTTQFEATDARLAFPCFDEPALKATFVIHIAPPIGYHAVSNMPVETIKGPDTTYGNRSWFNFEKSKKMSTYLVAFVVSDLSILENGTFRILVPPTHVESARYALSISPLILSTIANLTGVNYSLPKMDQVAVSHIDPAAMENWGLVIYSDDYLLTRHNTTDYHKLTASTIAHEFAHQWFGNLVSPDWWTYLWLSEGLANFFQHIVVDKIEKKWDVLNSMVTKKDKVMKEETYSFHTYPITNYVEEPSEINSAFGSLAYTKGGLLMRMAYHFLTEQTFFKGLNIYLKKRAYASATPDDLFAALEEAAVADSVLSANLTVKDILDTWTLQGGYPVLNVIRNYADGTAVITQESHVHDTADTKRWYVPISYTTRSQKNFSNTIPTFWLLPKENSSVTLEGLASEDWLVLNIQNAAYYVVNYDDINWRLLQKALNETDYDGIHYLNRVQILQDTSILDDMGLASPQLSLNILYNLRSEEEPVVRNAILNNMEKHYDKLSNTEHTSELLTVFAPVVENTYQLREDNMVTVDMKTVKDRTSALGVTSSLEIANYKKFKSMTPVEWCAAVRTDPKAWDVVWRLYEKGTSKKRRRDALAALGCARDAERLLTAAVADADESEHVSEEDRVAALAAPCGSETRRAIGGGGAAACAQAVAFVADHSRRIHRKLEDTEDYLVLVRRLSSRVRTEEQFSRLQHAASAVRIGQPPTLRTEQWTELLQTARSRVDWMRGDGASIISWLQNHAARTNDMN